MRTFWFFVWPSLLIFGLLSAAGYFIHEAQPRTHLSWFLHISYEKNGKILEADETEWQTYERCEAEAAAAQKYLASHGNKIVQWVCYTDPDNVGWKGVKDTVEGPEGEE